MPGYTKLFGSIITSTIWQEPHTVRIVWITMLAICDRMGEVHAAIPGLAKTSGVSLEECEEALSILSKPDKYSRTKDFEGRRIQEVDGGWILLNYSKYRKLMSADERREYNRVKKAESRNRTCQNSVNNCQTMSMTVNDNQHVSTMAESKEQKAIQKPQPSAEGLKFSEWAAVELFPDSKKVPSWKEDWALCYDDMLRLDGRTKQQVKEVCLFAIHDDLWSQHFHSPLKLRRRDKDKVMYFDVFSQKMKSATPAANESFL